MNQYKIRENNMTAKMNNSFVNYIDFLDLAIEAYKTAPRKVFTKIMHMIINALHEQSIEIEKQTLQFDNMNSIPINDLDEFYDTIIDGIDDIKLLQKRLKEQNIDDILFDELDEQLTQLYSSFVLHMDRMGQLEVRIMSQQQSA